MINCHSATQSVAIMALMRNIATCSKGCWFSPICKNLTLYHTFWSRTHCKNVASMVFYYNVMNPLAPSVDKPHRRWGGRPTTKHNPATDIHHQNLGCWTNG